MIGTKNECSHIRNSKSCISKFKERTILCIQIMNQSLDVSEIKNMYSTESYERHQMMNLADIYPYC